MQRYTRLGKAIMVLAMMSASGAFASEVIPYEQLGNLDNGKKIFTEGKNDVPACNSCHGLEALGDDAMGTPRLAGQGFVFIVKQLEDFATDKRMDTTMFIMNNNAKGLNEQDRRDVAAYVASQSKDGGGSNMQEVKELGSVPVGQRYLGKSLVQHGAPDRGVPACHSCHAYNGRGSFPVYPMLSGQRYVYMVNQLKKWRDGSRANDPLGQMRAVAKRLSDQDIYNAATFLTSAPRTTVGASAIPVQH
jgi:cytochrome c553